MRAVIFDFGHTILRENSCADPYLKNCPIELMPGAREAIKAVRLPKGIWANTRVATAMDIRGWLRRADLDHQIAWVSSSVELGHRKPDKRFFERALPSCGLEASDVLFVGNQMDTDIAGANAAGISCVYLSDNLYRSVDERVSVAAKPTFVIQTLFDLPGLIARLIEDALDGNRK